MEFSIKSGSPEKQRSGCVVVGIYDARKLSPSAQAIDGASRHYINEVLRRGDHDGKLGSTHTLKVLHDLKPTKITLTLEDVI